MINSPPKNVIIDDKKKTYHILVFSHEFMDLTSAVDIYGKTIHHNNFKNIAASREA